MTRRILQRLLRMMPPALSFAAGAAVMLLFLQPAHADPLIAVTPNGLELSWQAWLIAVAAAVGGALTILDKVLAWLKWLAPRTETTLDDRARDRLQVVDDVAHAKLDNILMLVGGLIPATGVPVTASDKPAAPALTVVQPPPGSNGAALLVVMLLGAIAAPALSGCTKAQAGAAATSAEHAIVNCTGQAIGTTPALDLATLIAVASQVAEIKAACTTGGSFDWSCAESAAIAKGKTIGGCALAQLLASPPASDKPATSSVAVAPAPPDPGRAAFEDFRARVAGGATFHTSSGDY